MILAYRLTKTYHSFRSLAGQLKKIVDKACSAVDGTLPSDVAKCVKFSESVSYLVNSQSTAYLEKVRMKNAATLCLRKIRPCRRTDMSARRHYNTLGQLSICQVVGAAAQSHYQRHSRDYPSQLHA